jgi:hypothetical protein
MGIMKGMEIDFPSVDLRQQPAHDFDICRTIVNSQNGNSPLSHGLLRLGRLDRDPKPVFFPGPDEPDSLIQAGRFGPVIFPPKDP